MGYFSNGTEGDMYQERWCNRCIHGGNCAVWEAHLNHNYEECNKPESILHELIPREGIHNAKCLMFLNEISVDRIKKKG